MLFGVLAAGSLLVARQFGGDNAFADVNKCEQNLDSLAATTTNKQLCEELITPNIYPCEELFTANTYPIVGAPNIIDELFDHTLNDDVANLIAAINSKEYFKTLLTMAQKHLVIFESSIGIDKAKFNAIAKFLLDSQHPNTKDLVQALVKWYFIDIISPRHPGLNTPNANLKRYATKVLELDPELSSVEEFNQCYLQKHGFGQITFPKSKPSLN
jgi:hypothetical protein